MTTPNFAVYQKPVRSEFEKSYEEQAKMKKQRFWPGKPVDTKVDSDDDIFNDAPKLEQETSQKEREIAPTTMIEEEYQQSYVQSEDDDEKVEVEEVDQEALNRRRQAVRNRLQNEEPIESIKVKENEKEEQDKSEKKKDKTKEKKEKKEKKKQKKEEIKKEEEAQQKKQEEEELEEEEYEEEVERRVVQLLKPVFVSKTDRDIQDVKVDEDTRLKEERGKNIERKKLENKLLLLTSVNQETMQKEVETDDEEKIKLPDDEDDENQNTQEYAMWKIRELKRLKKDHEERTKIQREKAEIERRRNLTDEQRIEEDFKLGSDKTKNEEQTKYVFMQKFYHRGAFFQDNDDPIFQRNFNLPVGEDLWDKSALPSILQKRRGQFGKRAQSKYTHLTDQDTTNYDPEYQVDESIRQKFFMKQAGMRAQNKFDQFFGKKK